MTDDDIVDRLLVQSMDEEWPPPATRDAVIEAEQVMQVRLPSLLRRIYLEVANGGFGPRHEIPGLRGGYEDSGQGENLVEMNTPTDAENGNLHAGYEYMISNGRMKKIDAVPLGMVFLLDWGCAIWSVLDCRVPGGAMWGCLEGALVNQHMTFAGWLSAHLDGAGDELMPDYRVYGP